MPFAVIILNCSRFDTRRVGTGYEQATTPEYENQYGRPREDNHGTQNRYGSSHQATRQRNTDDVETTYDRSRDSNLGTGRRVSGSGSESSYRISHTHQQYSTPRTTTRSPYGRFSGSESRYGSRDYGMTERPQIWTTRRVWSDARLDNGGRTWDGGNTQGFRRSKYNTNRNDGAWRNPSLPEAHTTKKPSGISKIVSSITDMLGHGKESKLSSANGGSGSKGESIRLGSLSKYSKYLIPAATFGGKHLVKLISSKFGSKGKSPGVAKSGGIGFAGDTRLPASASGYIPSNERDGSPYSVTNEGINYQATAPPPPPLLPVTPRTALTNGRTVASFMSFTRPPVSIPEKEDDIDSCVLARWNYEYPYSELPNLAIAFLVNDTVSGSTISEKSEFLSSFLLVASSSKFKESHERAFVVPEGITMDTCTYKLNQGSAHTVADGPVSTKCLVAQRMGVKLPECAARVSSAATENVSPYSTDHPAVAIRGFRKVYLNTSRGSSDLLEVVQAAGACYDRHGLPTVEKSAHCLNFSLTPEILLTLNTKSSMFGNEELCRSRNLKILTDPIPGLRNDFVENLAEKRIWPQFILPPTLGC